MDMGEDKSDLAQQGEKDVEGIFSVVINDSLLRH